MERNSNNNSASESQSDDNTLECTETLSGLDGIHKRLPAGKLWCWDANTQPSCREEIPPHATFEQRRYWNQIFDTIENEFDNSMAGSGTDEGSVAEDRGRSVSPYIPKKIPTPIYSSSSLESDGEDEGDNNVRRTESDTRNESRDRTTRKSPPSSKDRKNSKSPDRNSNNNRECKQQKNKTSGNRLDNKMAPKRGDKRREPTDANSTNIDESPKTGCPGYDMETLTREDIKRKLNFDVGGDNPQKKRGITTFGYDTERIKKPSTKPIHIDNKHLLPSTSGTQKSTIPQSESDNEDANSNTNGLFTGSGPIPESDNITGNFYTFIFTPKSQESLDFLSKLHPFKTTNRKRRPDYTYFIHGSEYPYGHIHVLFTASSNAITRKRERICRDLPLCNPNEWQCGKTTKIIKADTGTDFSDYCGRRGGGTHHTVGKGVKHVEDFYKSLKTPRDFEAAEGCLQYMEKKRNSRKGITTTDNTNPDGPDTLSFKDNQKLFSILNPYVEKYRPENLVQLQKILGKKIQLDIMSSIGPKWQGYAKQLIDIIKNDEKEYMKKDPYIKQIQTYINKDIKENPITRRQVYEGITWIILIFKYNGIDGLDFLAKFLLIIDQSLNKVNSFILRGQINTGKSMLMNLLLEVLNPTLLMRQGDASQFYFQNLICSTCVLFEEPVITPTSVNSFKLLMGGEKCATDVKNQNTHTIFRTPCFFTTNTALAAECASIHQNALKIRSFEFVLNSVISSDTINGVIPKPPFEITPTIMYLFILANIHEITEHQYQLYPQAKVHYKLDKNGIALEDIRPYGHDLDWIRKTNKPKDTDLLDELIGSDVTYNKWIYDDGND